MLNVFQWELGLTLVVGLVLLAVKVFAFINAVLYSAESYTAANKLTKQAWMIILGLGLAVQIVMPAGPTNLINLVFTIAAFVYLADVRPALAGLRRR